MDARDKWLPLITGDPFMSAARLIIDGVEVSAGEEKALWRERPAGMEETPLRFSNSMMDLTNGYREDPDRWWKTFDAEGADQMVVQHNIPLASLCEHHILPIVGHAHIGYIPKEVICGLSKLKRVVDLYARRFQVQERLTRQIADFLEDRLRPRGVIVVVEAEHFCMSMRGVQAIGTITTTSAVTGDFMNPAEGSRQEFMSLLRRREA